jgi:lipid-A-disaccharide synthase-like uncharacterized protein
MINLLNVAAYPTDTWGIIGIWAQLLFMFMIYSYPLYKENYAFRFAEHTYLALALATTIIVNIQSLIRTQLPPLINEGKIVLIIPVLLGFAMYLMMVPQYRWVSRYPIAILVGSALGLGMSSRILPNLQKQIINIVSSPAGAPMMDYLDFYIMAAGTIMILMYFILTYEHVGVLAPTTRFARWFIMVGLGVQFGNTILFRFTMLSGRALFVLQVLGLAPM